MAYEKWSVYPAEGKTPEKDFLERFAPAFTYGGKAFPAAELTCTKCENEAEKDIFHLARLSDDGLLRYTLRLIRYKNFPVIEWLPELENIGDKDTQLIEDFQSLSFNCPVPGTTPVLLQRNLGSQARQDDFLPADTILHERMQRSTAKACAWNDAVSATAFTGMQSNVTMECTRAGSSFDWLPFFGIRIAETCFLHFAIGWSGAWKTDFHVGEGRLAIWSGLRKTRFILHPGEKIRQSSFFIMEHDPEEDPEEAQNLFRRFMREYHSPHNRKGELIKAPLAFSCGGATHEPMLLEILDFIQQEKLPIETLWMDAGWYGGDHEEPEIPKEERNIGNMGNDTLGNWMPYRGIWDVNHIVHPHGLKFYADRAEQLGMNFLLWCEIENAVPNAPVAVEHPEWMLKTGTDLLLLNLGIPEARRWAFNVLRKKVEQEGAAMLRFDFSVNYLCGWDEADAPDRIGITETKYIMGFYQLWDEVRAMLPDAAIDNCAGGGRRLDFESLSRSIPLWRADGIHTPESHQIQVSELSRWIPQHECGLYGSPLLFGDDYSMLSLCATATQINYFPDQMQGHGEWLRKICRDICTLREGFLQNLYHLTQEVWNRNRIHALQCDSLAHDSGLVIVFRREGKETSCVLPLRHIAPDAAYEVTIQDKTETMSGRELLNYCFQLPQKHTVVLLTYRKK